MKKIVSLSAVFTLFLIFSASVFAATPQFTFRSADGGGKAIYNVSPGSTIKVDLEVTNLEKSINMTVGMQEEDFTYKDGVTEIPKEWYKMLSNQELKLAPMQKKIVRVGVTVPSDAKEGEYRRNFVVKLTDYDGASKGGSVVISPAIGIPLRIFVSPVNPLRSDILEPVIEESETPTEEDVSKGTTTGNKGYIYEYGFYFDLVILLLVILLIIKIYTVENKIVSGKKGK
jgi:hypothetical protein